MFLVWFAPIDGGRTRVTSHPVRKLKPWLVALVVVVVAACTTGPARHQTLPTAAPSTTPVPITPHGDLAVGSEQEPGCLDWIAACVTPSPGVYAVEANTLPRGLRFQR